MYSITIGAFFIGEFPEAVAVMLFYQIGGIIQSYAVWKIKKINSEFNGHKTRLC